MDNNFKISLLQINKNLVLVYSSYNKSTFVVRLYSCKLDSVIILIVEYL